MKFRFTQVDVFTDIVLRGNPLAVVHAAETLSEAQMQTFARWTNLSETSFLLPPTRAEADYRVRIFTPGGELPFAGHPTLGSCHAWREQGGVPKVRAFAAPIGINEDPVTGSLNASIAQWLMDEGIAPAQYVAAQGTRLDRSGRVHIRREADTVWVGGGSVSCIRGEVTL